MRFAALLFIALLLCLVPTLTLAQQASAFISYIVWSPDGTMLAVGGGTTVRIIDSAGMQVLNSLTELEEQTTRAAWSPDGASLAIANGADVEIWDHPWDLNAAQLVLTYQYYADQNPPEPYGRVNALAWSPTSLRIASVASSDIEIWDATTGERLLELSPEDWVRNLEYSQDGVLASGGGDIVTLWEDATGEASKYFFFSTYGIPAVLDIAWSPDGRRMVISYSNYSDESGIQLWDTTGDEEYTAGGSVNGVYPDFTGHTREVNTLSWSADGQYVASGSDDGTVRIWDAETTEQLSLIPVGENLYAVQAVAWSPVENRLAYGNNETGLKIISLTCTITTRLGVNLRSGPNQNAEQAGSRAADEILEANGQVPGSDGFVWWRLSSGEWVREDLVTEDANCVNLPVLETTQAMSLLDDICVITAIDRVNLRQGPGEDFDIVGSLDAGQPVDAFGYFPNIEYTWWATSQGWIRRDLVSEASDCSRVPQTDGYFPLPSIGGPGPCIVRTLSGVNLRSGPGANYDQAGSRAVDEQLEANGQIRGEDTFIWWRLTTGEWVREDLVSESDNCADVPLVTQITP